MSEVGAYHIQYQMSSFFLVLMKGVSENTEGMHFLNVNTKSNLQSCPPTLNGLRTTSEAIDLRDMPSVRSPQECRSAGDGEQKWNSCQSQPKPAYDFVEGMGKDG